MEQPNNELHLSLQPFDPEVFNRVWNRVMPDPSLSPIEPDVPALAAPAPLPQASNSAACLGESAVPYAPQLETLMDHLMGSMRTYQALVRRTSSYSARTLGYMAASLRRQLRRLETAYFLITGRQYTPSAQHNPPSSLPMALRDQFFLEQKCAALAQTQEGADPCLAQLFQEIREAAEARSDQIRALLEQRSNSLK